MGAFDTLAAAQVPCPNCGDRYWESCQTKFFDPDYPEQGYLYPGQGRELSVDPRAIARAELWDDQWLRIGEVARPDRFSLLLPEWERRTCFCAASLAPVAHVSLDGKRLTLDALELVDLRDPRALERIDFIDEDWLRLGAPSDWTHEALATLASSPRAARRAAFGRAITTMTMTPPSPDDETANHFGWTCVRAPARCEACGVVRETASTWLLTHPLRPDSCFFGDAWAGGELAPGARIASVAAALATDRLRGFFFRLRAPVSGALVLLERPSSYGCRCGVGRASASLRFRRDGADAIVLAELTWRVVRTCTDLDDVDWVETGCSGFLGRDDVDDKARFACILAERELSADPVSAT